MKSLVNRCPRIIPHETNITRDIYFVSYDVNETTEKILSQYITSY